MIQVWGGVRFRVHARAMLAESAKDSADAREGVLRVWALLPTHGVLPASQESPRGCARELG